VSSCIVGVSARKRAFKHGTSLLFAERRAVLG
jgi:hypothetical protein